MSTEAETVTFTKVVKIADADGVPIREGSVIADIKDGTRGVVFRIGRAGDKTRTLFSQIGDMSIRISAGVTHVSNRYEGWRHVPPADQTYMERFYSWCHSTYEHDADRLMSEGEGRAINGILALLPPDAVDWDEGPWPDSSLSIALECLAKHLEELKTPKKEKHAE